MKKFLAMLLVAAMVFSMAACAKAPEAAQPAATEETAGETAETAETPKDGKVYKVAMICDSSISDGGWGMSCYNAMMDAAEKHGWETAVSDSIEQSAYFDTIDSYCTLGYDMIYAPGNQYTDAVLQAAAEYPDIAFALLNGAADTPAKAENGNVSSLLPNATQIGWIAGALAGLMTETGTIAFIGGMELDTTKAKVECYEKAAQKINPDIKVSSAYAGSFSDTAKGKEIAASMVTTYDVDVMFGDASAVDTGAREALAGQEGRYDIGQPGDLGSADDKVIACSVVTDNAALVKTCMEDIENGTFGNKTVYGDLSNGCLSVGTFSSVVPEDIQKQYLEVVDQIKAGTFLN